MHLLSAYMLSRWVSPGYISRHVPLPALETSHSIVLVLTEQRHPIEKMTSESTRQCPTLVGVVSHGISAVVPWQFPSIRASSPASPAQRAHDHPEPYAMQYIATLPREHTNYTVLCILRNHTTRLSTRPCADSADLTRARSTVMESPRQEDDWHTDNSHRQRAEPTHRRAYASFARTPSNFLLPAAGRRCVPGTNRGGVLESEAAVPANMAASPPGRRYNKAAPPHDFAAAHVRADACHCDSPLTPIHIHTLPCSTLLSTLLSA
jgi:hypothetical protein